MAPSGGAADGFGHRISAVAFVCGDQSGGGQERCDRLTIAGRGDGERNRGESAPERATDEQALAGVLAQLEGRLDALVDLAADAIFAEIPAYQAHPDRATRRDVRHHVRAHLSTTIASFRAGRDVTAEDLLFIRRHAANRVGRLSVADFIHAFQVGQRILWDATLSLADDDATRRAVLSLVGHITRYFDIATTHAAEVYVEAEQLLGAAGERLRRDTLEDLLGGEAIAPGARQQALREAGLDERSSCIVIAAEPVAAVGDIHALRGAAAALARVPRQALSPLTVVRHSEIVVVAPARPAEVRGVVERLMAAQRRLQERVVPLAVGMSTVHDGLSAVPTAYREAADARGLLGLRPGTVALPAMRVFDYLIRHMSPTARRLIPAGVARFVDDDAAHGGALLATLRAYATADLNVKRAAEQLGVHVNTAHYRLARIEERTGANLRHVDDVIDLLIAAGVQ